MDWRTLNNKLFPKAFRKKIWSDTEKAMEKDWKNLPARESEVPLGRSNKQQEGNEVYAYQVKSWNRETHPDGMGRSQLVQDIDYSDGKLRVTYNDGFTAEYEGITPEQAQEFVKSDSKGRWALRNLWGKPYRQIK